MSDFAMERQDWNGSERRLARRDGHNESNGNATNRPAKALGYLSIGLGLTGLMFARRLNRFIGLRHRRAPRLTRAVGVRELVTGARLLGSRRPGPWLWARFAGDLIDLSLLGAGLTKAKRHRGRVLTAMAAIGGITAIDFIAAARARPVPAIAPKPVRRAITIAVPPEQAYTFWRDLENLPMFMSRLISVETLEPRRSRWRARGPAGKILEWEAETVEDVSNELIGWRSLPGSAIRHSGVVRFRPAPGSRGTEVSLEIEYEAPVGDVGRWFASLTHEAVGIHIYNDLRRLKQTLEVGEIVCSDASVHRGLHPARPDPSAKLVQKGGEI